MPFLTDVDLCFVDAKMMLDETGCLREGPRQWCLAARGNSDYTITLRMERKASVIYRQRSSISCELY